MELQQLHRKLDEVQATQVQILGYLHNNTGTGELGLVADYKEHKKEVLKFINKHNEERAVMKARVGLFASFFGVLSAAAMELGIKFLTKDN